MRVSSGSGAIPRRRAAPPATLASATVHQGRSGPRKLTKSANLLHFGSAARVADRRRRGPYDHSGGYTARFDAPDRVTAVRDSAATLALHAQDLAQGVFDVDQVGLGGHDGVDVLVGGRRLVDAGGVAAAFDALDGAGVVGQRDAPAGLGAGHGEAGAVAATGGAVRSPLAP